MQSTAQELCKAASQLPSLASSGSAEFDFLQKRKLSYDIGALDSKHLDAVLDIIKDSVSLDTSQDEIVIDIDSLDTATLRRRRDLVQSFTAKKADGSGAGKGASKGAPGLPPTSVKQEGSPAAVARHVNGS